MLTAVTLAMCALSQNPQVTMVFGGDVIPHDPVKHAARAHGRFTLETDGGVQQNNDGWDHVFGPLAQTFKSHDLAFVNCETPVGNFKKPETGEMVFHADPSFLRGLKSAGVTVATFANNHCLDQHHEGITSTRAYLKEAGLLSTGADNTYADSWKPLIIEKNGVRIGVLAFTRFLNFFHNTKKPEDPHVPLVHYEHDKSSGGNNEAELIEYVKAAAAQVEVLIVIPHWGDEYQTKPRPEDRALAQQILDAGALVIIGMHPHVLQPTEVFTRADGARALVAFSLGNLVSNQDFGDTNSLKRQGLLMSVTLEKTVSGVRVAEVTPIALHTENRMAAGKKRNIQPLVLRDEVVALQEREAELLARDGGVRAELKAVSARLREMQQRETQVLGTVAPEVVGRWATADAGVR